MVNIANIAGTSSEIEAPRGPCSGIEYRAKFNILSYFINVDEEKYCVDVDGNVVDCELACPQQLSDILGVGKYRTVAMILYLSFFSLSCTLV